MKRVLAFTLYAVSFPQLLAGWLITPRVLALDSSESQRLVWSGVLLITGVLCGLTGAMILWFDKPTVDPLSA
jgi:hypothetical protein